MLWFDSLEWSMMGKYIISAVDIMIISVSDLAKYGRQHKSQSRGNKWFPDYAEISNLILYKWDSYSIQILHRIYHTWYWKHFTIISRLCLSLVNTIHVSFFENASHFPNKKDHDSRIHGWLAKEKITATFNCWMDSVGMYFKRIRNLRSSK